MRRQGRGFVRGLGVVLRRYMLKVEALGMVSHLKTNKMLEMRGCWWSIVAPPETGFSGASWLGFGL